MAENPPPLIAHVIFRLAVGGLENGLVNLINGMPEENYRHAIICIDGHTDFRNRIQRDDVEVIAIHKRPGTDLSAFWRLYRTFRRIKPQIVHTRNLGALDGLLPAWLAGVPHRIHGEHGWEVSDLDGQNRKNRLLRKLHAPFIHRYISVSKHLASYLVEQVGISSKRISQIYNGVDTEKFRPSGDNLDLKRKIFSSFDQGDVIIGTVGRMIPVKDQICLVEAISLLVRRRSEFDDRVRLVIIGDGESCSEVRARIDELDLRERTWTPGNRDDIPDILRCMDVFVLPSLAEGISNTILEAMASGLPVIATDVGGNRELVAVGTTGSIVPSSVPEKLGNEIERYIDNPSMISEHGLAGRLRAKNLFSIRTMIRGYDSEYDRILDNPRT